MTSNTPETQARDLAQFFFEMGFGACYAEAIVRNGNQVPFPLSDAEIERQWAISQEAYDDADELEAMLSLARHRQSSSNAGGVDPKRIEDCINAAIGHGEHGLFVDVEKATESILASLSTPTAEPTGIERSKVAMLERYLRRARRILGSTPSKIADDIDAYFSGNALTTPPTPDRIRKDAVREALEDAFCAGWDARHDGQNYYESRDNYVTRALSATPAQEVDETERLRSRVAKATAILEQGRDGSAGYRQARIIAALSALQHKAEVSRG